MGPHHLELLCALCASSRASGKGAFSCSFPLYAILLVFLRGTRVHFVPSDPFSKRPRPIRNLTTLYY